MDRVRLHRPPRPRRCVGHQSPGTTAHGPLGCCASCEPRLPKQPGPPAIGATPFDCGYPRLLCNLGLQEAYRRDALDRVRVHRPPRPRWRVALQGYVPW